MGRILKAVYSNTFNYKGQHNHVSNGLPKLVVDYCSSQAEIENSWNPPEYAERIKQQNANWQGNFNLSNFYYYFQKFYGTENVISPKQISDDECTYIYPVEIATTINALYEDHSLTFNGNAVNYKFLDTVDAVSLTHMKAGRLKIVINNIQDPITNHSSVRKFELILDSHGIPTSNLIYIFGNDFNQYYKEYPESKVKILSGILPLQQQALAIETSFPSMTSLGYISDIVRYEDIVDKRDHYRSKKFLSFNRSLRSHRYYLAYLAMEHDLFKNSTLSFINIFHSFQEIKQDIEKFLGYPITNEKLDALMALLPQELDTHHLTLDEKMGFVTNGNKKEWYLESYIHITSETVFDVNYDMTPFFSEKTFRPITNLQPFIFLGNAHSLKKLHELGFKTFHPVIDESYDTVDDPVARMRLIEKEIVKLNELPLKELHELYHSLESILLHNFNHFLTFKNTNPFESALSKVLTFNER